MKKHTHDKRVMSISTYEGDMVDRCPPPCPNHVHTLIIPGTCEYVPLHGKADFADVIKNLEVERISWNLGEPIVIIRDLMRGKEEGQGLRRQCDDRGRS